MGSQSRLNLIIAFALVGVITEVAVLNWLLTVQASAIISA